MDRSVLSAEELHHFEKWGYVRVPHALSEGFVERVRTVIWRELEAQHAMVETDPSTWRPDWCGINKDIIDGSARTQVTERLSGAISQILGEGQWRPIRTYGGLLMTMPEPHTQAWEAAGIGWHFDNDPRFYLSGFDELMLFTFYSSVEAQGGGTLALAGSHRLIEAFLQSGAAEGVDGNALLKAFVKWHPYLAQLQGLQPREHADAYRIGTVSEVNGIEVYVAEFTGEPGEAILCHPALLHAGSRNPSNRPRIMRRTNIRRLRKRSEEAT
jgi:hypothetical protein